MNDLDVRVLLACQRSDLEAIRSALDAVLKQLTGWQELSEAPPEAEQVQKLRETLITGLERFSHLESHEQEVGRLLQRVITLHESMKTAYLEGYDARLLEIKAKAIGVEYAQLRRLLGDFHTEDELPF